MLVVTLARLSPDRPVIHSGGSGISGACVGRIPSAGTPDSRRRATARSIEYSAIVAHERSKVW